MSVLRENKRFQRLFQSCPFCNKKVSEFMSHAVCLLYLQRRPAQRAVVSKRNGLWSQKWQMVLHPDRLNRSTFTQSFLCCRGFPEIS